MVGVHRSVPVLLLITLLSVSHVSGHGYASGPFIARNVARSNYCPHCANGPSPCGGGGGQWEQSTDVDVLAGSWTVQPTEVKAGDVIEIEVRITAAHKGHFILDLCRPTGERITHECFSTRLKRDPTDTRHSPYLASDPYAFFMVENSCATQEAQKARFIMPEDAAACNHCVLRWYWQTGNSCLSHPSAGPSAPSEIKNWSRGTCKAALGDGGLCGSNCPTAQCSSEQFKNCMDVRIVPKNGGGSVPTPSPTTSSTKSTLSSSTLLTSSSPGVPPSGSWPGCGKAKPNAGSGLTEAHCAGYCSQIISSDGRGVWTGCGNNSTNPVVLKECLGLFNCTIDL